MLLINFFKNWSKRIDWVLMASIIPMVFFGLITMNSFKENNFFFERQILWVVISLIAFFIVTLIDFKFLRRTQAVFSIYLFSVASLALLFITGTVLSGSRRWIDIGFLTFQPSELAKLAIVILLAKYFSKRHVEIKNYIHLMISGGYAFILFALIAAQPDFGSALIIFMIWFGMVMVSGLSKKHFLVLIFLGVTAFSLLWTFALVDYQKARILTFVNPLEDIKGTGYNAHQSMISVGSGRLIGKGVGFGSQSRLNFLPEYQTDFIFAAFAEEWGFLGVLILFISYLVFLLRIISISHKGATNFEVLFGLGLAVMFMSHFFIHVGMNMGLMPITGLPLPFVSYGGTNLLVSFISVGILMSLKNSSGLTYRESEKNEITERFLS